MTEKREIRWLFDQLPEWVAEGLLHPEQADQLRMRYSAEHTAETRKIDPGIVAIGIIGALLIVGGIISIIAYNWENMEKGMKLLVSMVPAALGLICYGYTWLRHRQSIVWAESASAVLQLLMGASISLYLQTTGRVADADTFLKPWLWLSIPLLYGMNSSLSTLIYLFGITSWVLSVSRPDSVWYWGFLLAALPHVIWNFRRVGQEIRKQLLSWAVLLSWAFGWFATTPTQLPEYAMVGTACWLSSFYLLSGTGIIPGKKLFRQPFLFIGLAGIFIMVLLGAFELDINAFNWNALWETSVYPFPFALANFVVLLTAMSGLIALAWIRLKTQDWVLQDLLVVLFPVVAIVQVLLAGGRPDNQPAMLLANVYGLAVGVAYLRAGLRTHNLQSLNIGMLFVLALAVTRFFDTDWSLIVKGLAFIALGVSFLLTNFYIARQKGKGNVIL